MRLKHYRLKIFLTVLLAVFFVLLFSWIVAWQNYRRLSREAAKEKPLTWDAVSYTLENLSESWADYEAKIKTRYEVEAVFASLALQNVISDGIAPEEEDRENGIVVSIRDGELTTTDPEVRKLGLNASLLKKRSGSFAAPDVPSTFVVYSRIGNTDSYFVKWYEDTDISDTVRETLDLPGLLQRTEIIYDVPAIFAACDPDSGEITGILYKNDRYFSDCESLEDLGLTPEDLKKSDGKNSGKLKFDEVSFSYVSGESELPAGYVILLEPVPDLFAKAFIQAGYMIAVLMITVTTLLVAGFSFCPYVLNNILTPEEEKSYQPAHVRSIASLYGVLGIVLMVLFGMFGYVLNGIYDDVVRGRERLGMMDDSISMYTERYSQNMQTFYDVYLDYGNHIARLLDTYPQLRNAAVLSTLADSISASSIILYDADGCETVSSGGWVGLELGTDPDSATYDFRRILKGVPSILHDPETDEVTGLNEMRLGIQIRDDQSDERYGVMMVCVDLSDLTGQDIDPAEAARQIVQNLSDPETSLWIADAESGRILVAGTKELEGKNIAILGLNEQDLRGSLIRDLKTEEGDFFVTSDFMETPGILEWTEASEGVIAYYRGPKNAFLSGMLVQAITGGILFLVIYSILACIILAGYTDDFYNSYKHVKGFDDPKKELNLVQRIFASASPLRKGIVTMELSSAFVLLQIIFVVNSNSSIARNTVYNYISSGEWEKGFNLFAIAAVMILLAKVALLVIGLRFLTSICAFFSGPRRKTIFRLIANVVLYIALFFFLIKALEYFGFSPAAIAAGIGSMALAISLGAQNFVSDIIAGLTYVFEGTVHVGDIVQLGIYGSGTLFQGKVVEVGIRSVRLLTPEGDIITCSNRDIRTIKNSTQLNSRVICELVVSSSYPADELEQMLNAELPEIGRTDRQILSGPSYNGIVSIGGGKMTLSVSAECREEDYSYVRDRINAALQRIFLEHGYSL